MLFSLTTFLSSENSSSLIREKKLCNCFPVEHNLFLNTGILLAARLLGHENYIYGLKGKEFYFDVCKLYNSVNLGHSFCQL